MRPLPSLAAMVVAAAMHPALAGRIQGVATDLSGTPLAGVVVKRLSTGDSTTSGLDGSWRLAWTTGVPHRTASGIAPRGLIALRDGHLAVSADGFRVDGRSGILGGSTTVPDRRFAPRTSETPTDTLSMRWKGAWFKQPLPVGAQMEDMGRSSLDTAGLGHFEIRASRFETSAFTGMRFDVVSFDATIRDSLALRLHMSGTIAEMADFAMLPDIAQLYDEKGFQLPARVDGPGISRLRPRPLDGTCATDGICDWVFDIPLDSVSLGPQYTLFIQVTLGRHLLERDTSSFLFEAPKHDPFDGSDWSFRAHWKNGMMLYGGVPLVSRDEAERNPVQIPTAPYLQLLHGGRPVYGRGPETED